MGVKGESNMILTEDKIRSDVRDEFYNLTDEEWNEVLKVPRAYRLLHELIQEFVGKKSDNSYSEELEITTEAIAQVVPDFD